MQMRKWQEYISRNNYRCHYLATPSALAPPPTNITRMAFAGRWETETQEGYDAFCKLLGEKRAELFIPLIYWTGRVLEHVPLASAQVSQMTS